MAAQPEKPTLEASEAGQGLVSRVVGAVKGAFVGTETPDATMAAVRETTADILVKTGRFDLLSNDVVFNQAVNAMIGQVMMLQAEPEWSLLQRAQAFLKWLHGQDPDNIEIESARAIYPADDEFAYLNDEEALLGEIALLYQELEELYSQMSKSQSLLDELLQASLEAAQVMRQQATQAMNAAGVGDAEQAKVNNAVSALLDATALPAPSKVAPAAKPAQPGAAPRFVQPAMRRPEAQPVIDAAMPGVEEAGELRQDQFRPAFRPEPAPRRPSPRYQQYRQAERAQVVAAARSYLLAVLQETLGSRNPNSLASIVSMMSVVETASVRHADIQAEMSEMSEQSMRVLARFGRAIEHHETLRARRGAASRFGARHDYRGDFIAMQRRDLGYRSWEVPGQPQFDRVDGYGPAEQDEPFIPYTPPARR